MAKVKASVIINKAKSYVGTKEKPANSNNVVFNTDYYGHPVHGDAYPWCCVFLWDIFRMCGASSIFYDGKKCAYTPTLADWFKSKKRWHSTPKVGDIVFFQFAGSNRICHVGICIEVLNAHTIKTIEGNTSTGNDSNGGAVMVRTRATTYIKGYGRPDYATSSTSTPAKTSSTYTQSNFIKDVETALKVKNPDSKATDATLDKTITLSTTKNSTHKVVEYVQKYLKAKGYACSVTKKYDNQTASAVKAYQKKKGTTIDGIITAKKITWKNLLGLNK